MSNLNVEVPIESPEFAEAAEWIEEQNNLMDQQRREELEAARVAAQQIEEEMYGPIRDQLGLPADPPDPHLLQAYTDQQAEVLARQFDLRIAEQGEDPANNLLLPPQTNSCVFRNKPFTGAFASPSSKASSDASTGRVRIRVSSGSYGLDTAVAGMGYWFKAGSYISGYKTHAYADVFGSGALNGWFGTAKLSCHLTLRVFNWNKRQAWRSTTTIPGGSVWFGVAVGAGFNTIKFHKAFCQADKGDWLYLQLSYDVDAEVNALGHASVSMEAVSLGLGLCS